MYYENFEDYMRGNNNNGYTNMPPNPYYNYTYPNQFNNTCQNGIDTVNNLYPELYKEINRKIENICNSKNCRLIEDDVNKITDQIYEDYKDKTLENSKTSRTNGLIRDFIKILVIKYLLSKRRNTNYFPMNPMQMPNNYYPY